MPFAFHYLVFFHGLSSLERRLSSAIFMSMFMLLFGYLVMNLFRASSLRSFVILLRRLSSQSDPVQVR